MGWGAIAGSSWASGLNLYATVFILGLAGREGWADTPSQLHATPVLIAAAVLYAIEFFADKIPYIDNAWDSIHTVIRPVGAAWLAGVMAGDATWTKTPLVAAAAALLALSSHGAKATTRVAANVSPEPFSNIALSVGEDGIVAAMMTLVVSHPLVAGCSALVLAVLCAMVIWKLAHFIRGARSRAKRLLGSAA